MIHNVKIICFDTKLFKSIVNLSIGFADAVSFFPNGLTLIVTSEFSSDDIIRHLQDNRLVSDCFNFIIQSI